MSTPQFIETKPGFPGVIEPKETGLGLLGTLRQCLAKPVDRHGESVKVVQLRLGHATAAETLDTYAHLGPTLRTGPAPPSTPF